MLFLVYWDIPKAKLPIMDEAAKFSKCFLVILLDFKFERSSISEHRKHFQYESMNRFTSDTVY